MPRQTTVWGPAELMTTTAKLWLGFGTLVSLLVLIVAPLVYWLRALDAQVTHLTTVVAPRADAVQRMGAQVNAVAASVADYLQTGDRAQRTAAAESFAEFEQRLEAYRRLARSEQDQELSAQLARDFADYQTLSLRLLHDAEEEAPPEDLRAFLALRGRLSRLLDREMHALTAQDVARKRQEARTSVGALLAVAMALLAVGLAVAVVASVTAGRGIVSAEQTLRITLSSIADAVITTDTLGQVEYLNPVAESLTGWMHADAAGRPLAEVFQIVDEQTREPVEDPIEQVLKTGGVAGLASPTLLVAKDGSVRPIDPNAAPIVDKTGKLIGAVLVFRDVSQRRQAERALQVSAARKAATLSTALDGVITIDHGGNIIEFNRAAERIFGYRREDVLGREMAELLVPPALRQRHREGIAHYLRTGEGPVLNRHLEMTGFHANGAEFPIELAITRLSKEDPPVFTGFVRDITERKQAQAENEEQLRLLRLAAEVGASLTQSEDLGYRLQICAESIVNNLDAAFARIWMLNEPGNVLELKASAGMYTHLDGGHARIPLGRFKIGMIAQEGKPHLTNSVLGDPRVPEQEWAKREGLVSFAGYPLSVEGRVMGVLGMFSRHPLTPGTLEALASIANEIALGIRQQRAEEELRRVNVQLDESNQALQRSNRELEQFASVASHDLQEPLRKIQAFGDRLQAKYLDALDETGRDYIQRMQVAAARMRKLIDDLLSFSRVTTKAQPFEPVDLNEVAAEVASDLEGRLQETGGAIELGPLPTLDADRTQMRQLLQNLIGNGLKFHKPDTPPAVYVQARLVNASESEGKPPGGAADADARQASTTVELSVSDNGIGFEEIYLDRIFQVFQRLHGRLEYEGTGVGLAICRKIAERHGGNITARSAPGQGATFLVTLPLRQPTPDLIHDEF